MRKQTRRPRFQIYQDRGKKWRWRLRAANGAVIADGSEGYDSKRGARKALDRVVDASESAALIDAQERAR